MLVAVAATLKILEILAVKGLRILERGMAIVADVGACSECGGLSFVIWNWDDPGEAGTVRIDDDGQVLQVEGLLACASCFEIFEPEGELHATDTGLRLIEGGK